MTDFDQIYQKIYQQNQYQKIYRKKNSPLKRVNKRANSIAVVGGFLGDEGKGRITDEFTANFLTQHPQVLHYRDNGGANAGHTVSVDNIKIGLHQLGSGVLQSGCVVVSGKEMVIHPQDFVSEIEQVKKLFSGQIPAQIVIDEMSFLSLDTHRAFETALKKHSVGKAATGRGISPAYADILYRNPLRIRDLYQTNWEEKFTNHYQLYQSLTQGLTNSLAEIEVMRLNSKTVKVGNLQHFLSDLNSAKKELKPFIKSAYQLIKQHWRKDTPIVFEKAQALGLDKRWGVYPDITASDCSFEGIFSSTEGVVDPDQIAIKAAAIKATYQSSVGTRKLPSQMTGPLADRIREDAHEYGVTTGRPRDIVYVDLPMLSYLLRVGKVEYLVVTHLDICYQEIPLKIVVGYQKNGKRVDYRPDQEYLNTVEPIFAELPSWDGKATALAKEIEDLPTTALQYLYLLEKTLKVKILMATTGPKRNQTVKWY